MYFGTRKFHLRGQIQAMARASEKCWLNTSTTTTRKSPLHFGSRPESAEVRQCPITKNTKDTDKWCGRSMRPTKFPYFITAIVSAEVRQCPITKNTDKWCGGSMRSTKFPYLAIPVGDAIWVCSRSFFFRHDFVRAISLEPLLAETPN